MLSLYNEYLNKILQFHKKKIRMVLKVAVALYEHRKRRAPRVRAPLTGVIRLRNSVGVVGAPKPEHSANRLLYVIDVTTKQQTCIESYRRYISSAVNRRGHGSCVCELMQKKIHIRTTLCYTGGAGTVGTVHGLGRCDCECGALSLERLDPPGTM